MFQQFLHHIERNKLFSRTDKILLTVSGGLDSMVMLSLFKEAGFNIGVAHCNFQLRGEESKGDETLVNMICVEAGIPFHLKRFETAQYATERGVSIQMAARELRYDFFAELSGKHHYNYIATAHHLNDSIETVFLNLIRGTGINGVTGIALKSGNVIRPLLFATRDEIKAYAEFLRLSWREDSSNTSDKYHRNFLRNQVIPLLKTINPELEHNFSHTLERLRGTASLQHNALRQFKDEAIRESETEMRINVTKLRAHQCVAVVLWETIKDKGFSYVQCIDVLEDTHHSGRVFYSTSHQLTVDRDDLILTKKKEHNNQASDVVVTDDLSFIVRDQETLMLRVLDKGEFVLDKDSATAQLDYDTITFPLTWRTWRPGDSFIPLGMQQRKKISDFLIDIKIPLPEKDAVTVLESNGEIVWLIGHRIGNPFKINDSTSRVLIVKLT